MLRTLILIAAFIAVKGDNVPCVPLEIKKDRIVCVCNSTYCDKIDSPKLQAGQFYQYTSTRSGERLNLSVGNISNETQNFSDEPELILVIDGTEKYQKIHGFGGAMTDAAALNIRTLSNETQQKLIDTYYGPDGSRYTFSRIPIAGTDFSTRPYTYDDTPNDTTLSNFSLVEEDTYKIDYLHRIKSVMNDPGSLRIFTTSWSAPTWMKKTNNIRWGNCYSNYESGILSCSLKPEYYQLYADYIRKFFDAYKERGIDIWGITPGNEPLDGLLPFFPFNAMLWTPSDEARWSAYNLAPTLSKAGYKSLVYMAMDDQRYELPWYVDIMFHDEKAKELFTGIALHWYGDRFSPERLSITQYKYPDKFILMTEACAGSSILDIEKVILGSWDRGEQYILSIIQDLSHWVTGWVDWNIALNKTGGPNWANNFVDSPIIVIPENDEFYKQPMYYALFHVSRFVPRHSHRIMSTSIEKEDIKSIAFLTPDNEVVTIIVNTSDRPYNITLKEKKAENKKMDLLIPAHSFNTILYLLPE